jgi:acyl transferase domain-containing protein/NAD(P)H-dependent flavin oxidoreductase YrpB (nitropropane dioxygenase family)/NAD(P)-dependent dehydrogenase (short-subunit alcohol dehydrogenase family)
MRRQFQLMAVAPPLWLDTSISIAASQAGSLGALDLQYWSNEQSALKAINELSLFGGGSCGVKLDGLDEALAVSVISALPTNISFIILTRGRTEFLGEEIRYLHRRNLQVLFEATCVEDAYLGSQIGADAVIAKGNEAAGTVGEETTFILLQRLLEQTSLPLWVQGGVGLHSAAACYVAGAAGAVLDTQLWLTRESSLPETVKSFVTRMDGSETVCLGQEIGDLFRVYCRHGSSTVHELRARAEWITDHIESTTERSKVWRQAVRQHLGWKETGDVWPVGQDAAFAKVFADRFGTVAGALGGIRQAIGEHVHTANRCRPFDRDSAMARSHKTRYPIVQGPMTRVSDTAGFAERVADAGGLPFLALALMRAEDVETLLTETNDLLGERSWGVGILGFVSAELRSAQLNVIRALRPPFALIAGSRPDQAQTLEEIGIATYLHVPSPALLKLFIESGARRFVFEGRECGGHVGPRSSFVLWEQVTDVLLEATSADDAAERYHILFAGGIHDARSAAMVAAMVAPLAARGLRLGLLMGTAYLFTKEAVEAGAILRGFQEEALQCNETVLLESRLGHETRCARTPYAELFERERRKLRWNGLSVEDIGDRLESLNLGRLRIASKGITHDPEYGKDPAVQGFIPLSEDEQHNRGMYMIGQAAALRNEVCEIKELHRDVSINGSEWVGKLGQPKHAKASNGGESPCSDLAIIGMSCLFPKAGDLQTYWENILTKVNAIREIPKDRWNWDRYFDADVQAQDKIYSKWGGFLDDVPFDPVTFGLPPSSLKSIEPLQLLTLEAVRTALEDAGYRDRQFARDRTSVILGVGGGIADLGHQYAARSALPMYFDEVPPIILERLPEWTEDSFPGILQNVAAGRVANRFNLGGVNFTVDAACASSLAAVYLAAHELRSGNSEMVIVGAADTVQNPLAYLCFSKTRALSRNGKCRTFDESADGIVISEGVAVIVLKRLADAERDGDRIYALIKGVGTSSDGREKSLTAPRVEGQILALQRAYENAEISPKSVRLIEAHGTGTVAGDYAEIEALKRVFEEAGANRQTCAIGSVKSMIGHTKCAAGLAGLIKLAMSLYHKVLPPTAEVDTPNRKVGFSESPLYVNSVARPWIQDDSNGPRRGGVSSFGFGGTNFHVVLEEYCSDVTSSLEARSFQERWPSELLLWRAKTRQDLIAKAQLVQIAVEGGADPAVRELASAVWQQSRHESEGPERGSRLTLAIVASSSQDLAQKLSQAIRDLSNPKLDRIDNPRGVYFSQLPLASNGKLAFLFPGQGSQYPDMLCELAMMFSEIRESFETADRVINSRIPRGLSSYVFPPPRFEEEEEKSARRALMQTDLAQPALGAAELGLFRLLGCFGVKPDMLAGHSYGEYVALQAAGVFDEECLLLLSEARGRFIREEAGATHGTMAAVESGEEDIREIIEGITGVWIANLNAPNQTVISGEPEAVERALRTLSERGISARHLPVACAFHSPLVAGARDRLAELLLSIKFERPQLEVFSNTLAALYPDDPQAIKTILGAHLTRPVHFLAEAEAMYGAGARLFVEVGPSSALSGLISRILRDRPHRAVATDVAGRSGLVQLQFALAQLGAEGVPVCLDRLFARRRIRPLRLESLVAEAQDQPLSATTWLVNGGRARPLRESEPSATKLAEPISTPDLVIVSGNSNGAVKRSAIVSASSNGRGSPLNPYSQKPSILKEESLVQSRQEVPSSEGDGVSESGHRLHGNGMEAMLQFQKLMDRFLETQQEVMLAFFRNTKGAALPPRSTRRGVGNEIPQAATPLSLGDDISAAPRGAMPGREQFSVAESSPAAVAPVLAAAITDPDPSLIDGEALTAKLISIVSERTGYPPEMLDLDLNLEADLGINSIKKVEILGTFQRQCSDTQRRSLQSAMDRLTRLKTLREVIEGITSALQHGFTKAAHDDEPVWVAEGARAAVLPGVASVIPDIDPNPAEGETLTGKLINIVSERTGYPPEMLNLDLNLEADLGINSIKKVEILGTFQRQCSDTERRSLHSAMDRLTRLKSLREVIEGITSAIQLGSKNAVRDDEPVSIAEVAPAAVAPVSTSAIPDTDPNFIEEETVSGKLISIVSERTGYPREMLDLDLNLEADLGINSIKKVEILGTFQRQCSDTERRSLHSAMDRLTRLKSLREVIEGIMSAIQYGPAETARDNHRTERPTDIAIEVPFDGATHDPLLRYRRVVVAARAISPGSLQPPDGAVLITDDGRGVATALAKRLREAGGHTIVIRLTGRSEPRDGSSGASLADISALTTEVRKQAGTIGGLIHLLPLRLVDEFRLTDPAMWRERLDLEVRSLFLLAREIGHDLVRARGAWFVAASALGGDFGFSAPAYSIFPGHGAIAGFVKALASEWPGVRCKAIDFDSSQPANLIADWLLEELTVQAGEPEIGRRLGQRLHLRTTSSPVSKRVTEHFDLNSDSVVLVTGGARGITSAIAVEIARRYQPTLILIGRSPPPPVNESPAIEGITGENELKGALIRECLSSGKRPTAAFIERSYRSLLKAREMRLAIQSMEHAGAEVHYYQADVSDADAVASLINQIYETHGHLDGVIHGAGIIEDSLVLNKDVASYDRVFGTKVKGALAIIRNIRFDSLKLLIFFSSVSGIFGNRGQADYGSANEVLNKLASALDRVWPARVVALNWGPWADIGMASPEIQQKFLAHGVQLIKPDLGRKMFALELEHGGKGETEIILGSGPWSKDQATPSHANVRPLALLEECELTKRSRGDIELTCTFDLDSHPYLLDHTLDLRPVLPAAVGLEIIAEAAQYAWPDLEVISVTNFRVLNGIVLKDNRVSVRVTASWEVPTSRTQKDVAVRVEISHPFKDAKFYQALVILGVASPTTELNPERVTALRPYPWSVSTAYEQFLFHGPVFRSIEDIHGVNERCISASLVPSSPPRLLRETAAKEWLIDPLVVDGAFQLAILWARQHSDVTVLPVGFDRFSRIAPLVGSRIICNLVTQPNDCNHVIEAEVSFLDDAGCLLAMIEGMEFSGSKSLNRLSDSKARLHIP